jgi:hypothetical protein
MKPSDRIIKTFEGRKRYKNGSNILKKFTLPTNIIGIKKDGTAEIKPRSKYSNSVKLCQ